MIDIYFIRQCFILTTGLFYSFCVGFELSFPAVLNQALTSANSTDLQTTGDHASWIAAMNGIGGVLGCFIIPIILHTLGRKAAQISMNSLLLIGWIIISLAKNIEALYAARFIQGFTNGGIYVNIIIISEYVHPTRRGYFIALKKIFIAFGTLCCHAMYAVWTWRQIAVFAAVPPLISIIMAFFWPESPSFLALKGKYDQCKDSFKYMNGNSMESQRLLKLLLEVQTEKNNRIKNRKNLISGIVKQFSMRDFQKALLIASFLTIALDLSGRYYIMAYVIQIMADLLGNTTSALYFTVASDLITLLALMLSGVVIRCFKRRTLLFGFGATATILMFLISGLVYLKTVVSFTKHMLWLIAFILILQGFTVNVGLVPASFVIIGEIFPLEHKSLGSCSSGLVFTLFYAVILKITPILMENTQLCGTYAIFGVFLGVFLAILYKIVPETKDKALQEIEDDLNGVTRNLNEENLANRLL